SNGIRNEQGECAEHRVERAQAQQCGTLVGRAEAENGRRDQIEKGRLPALVADAVYRVARLEGACLEALEEGRVPVTWLQLGAAAAPSSRTCFQGARRSNHSFPKRARFSASRSPARRCTWSSCSSTAARAALMRSRTSGSVVCSGTTPSNERCMNDRVRCTRL